MKIALLLLLASPLLVSCLSVISKPEKLDRRFSFSEEWQKWKSTFNKEYKTIEEEIKRWEIFLDNQKFIEQHNMQRKPFSLIMNHLGDMSLEEYKDHSSCLLKINKTRVGSTYMPPENIKEDHLPKHVDWRDHGFVTPVKNQGQCGSCWAFSTTGSLEGQHFRKTGKLVSLSEQNLVDCSGSFGNMGCNGGLMDDAFQYIKQNGGIDSEASYPYTAENGQCRYRKADEVATDTGFQDIEKGSESDLKKAVAHVGPISIAIDASHRTFQFYDGKGVYDEPECSSTELDHGVLIVGYGVEDNGDEYWLVKNSWGESWGLGGYIKMARNKNNQCGVASSASYPLV